jgi:GT2 family glycosyltransferase
VTRISVVIPTLGREMLPRALGRLEAQEGVSSGDFEVVVIEDPGAAEEGAAARALESRALDARTLRADRPGASAARNAGWRAARAPLVLFTGDDILASPRFLAEHLAAHERHPEEEVGVLGRVDWADELRVTTFMRWLDRGIQFDFDTIRDEDAGWWRLYTANCSLKRSLIEAVGGFDEETFPFLYEDLDLGKRMSDAHGFRLLYAPDAHGGHVHPMTPGEWRRRAAAIAPMELRFTRKHPGFEPYFLNLFSAAAAAPPARGLLARLAPVVPPGAPVIGERVWASVDRRYRQELAPAFLDAWERAEREEGS